MSKKLFGMVKTVLAVYGGYKLAEPVITQVKEDVKTYFLDHTLPELKEDIVRGMTRGIETLLFGAPRNVQRWRDISKERPKYEPPRRDYTSYAEYQKKIQAEREGIDRNLRTLVFDTYKDADSLLRYLKRIWDREGQISVEDVYIGCGMKSTEAESKYGWVRTDEYGELSPDLWNIDIKYVHEGWIIKFPLIEPLY